MDTVIVKILLGVTPEMSKIKQGLTQDWTWGKILLHGLRAAARGSFFPSMPPQPIIKKENRRTAGRKVTL